MNKKPFETNYAGAIYGLILSMSVISALSKDDELSPAQIAVWTAITALVFWVAHVYSQIVAAGFARPSEARDLVRTRMLKEWPLVQGSLIPAAALLLAPLGLIEDDMASYVAVWVGVAALFLAGLAIGTREGISWGRRITIGLINASIGSLIVALKIFVH